jgi:hypothetical protein
LQVQLPSKKTPSLPRVRAHGKPSPGKSRSGTELPKQFKYTHFFRIIQQNSLAYPGICDVIFTGAHMKMAAAWYSGAGFVSKGLKCSCVCRTMPAAARDVIGNIINPKKRVSELREYQRTGA